ncbi:MAG TPA: hypothetical protein ENJ68_01755 [Devosia sp.]|nr:hypothetical protein [Devosia sp.]
MVLSLLYYSYSAIEGWLGQIFGLHNNIWDMLGLPPQPTSPHLTTLLAGMAAMTFTLISLAWAYAALWKILDGGTELDFRQMATLLRRLAHGLIGFWLGYNLVIGPVIMLVIRDIAPPAEIDPEWDLLDIHIVFLILAIALLAISHTQERAWKAEEETRYFL